MPPAKLKLPFGTGVYETIAIVNRHPAFLQLHLDRLAKGAELLQVPKARERVEQLIVNKLASCPETPTAMRVDAPGHGIPGATLRPRKQLPEGALGLYWPKAGKARGIEDTLKHSQRAGKITARNEAQAAGCWECVVLNEKGIAAEGTITNLWAVLDGAAVTPGDDLFPLPGIARHVILEEAKKQQIPVVMKGLSFDDLLRASEVFLTNTQIGALHVDFLVDPEGKRHDLGADRAMSSRLEAARQAREDEDLRTAPGPIIYGE